MVTLALWIVSLWIVLEAIVIGWRLLERTVGAIGDAWIARRRRALLRH